MFMVNCDVNSIQLYFNERRAETKGRFFYLHRLPLTMRQGSVISHRRLIANYHFEIRFMVSFWVWAAKYQQDWPQANTHSDFFRALSYHVYVWQSKLFLWYNRPNWDKAVLCRDSSSITHACVPARIRSRTHIRCIPHIPLIKCW